MTADYTHALGMFVPDSIVFPNTDGYIRKYIVLHKTAGGSSAQGTAQYFIDGSDGRKVSAHFVVGMDGTVVQCVRLADGAGGNCCLEDGHAGFLPTNVNLNLVSFSIECVDPATDNSTPMPLVQQQALFPLVKFLCEWGNIPMRPGDAQGGILAHAQLEPQSRAHCPGNFAWDALWAYLKGSTQVGGVPDGWADDGTTLKAPNGHTVVKGMRDYILKHDWDASNWPVEDEQHDITPLEMSNPALGAGNRQRFRMGTLEYTTERGVFPAYVGPEMMAMEKRIHELSAQVTTLQAQLAKATGKK
jgi:N-acetyl-anhydromuramyl-L-alanine amidase AmpD